MNRVHIRRTPIIFAVLMVMALAAVHAGPRCFYPVGGARRLRSGEANRPVLHSKPMTR